MTVLILFICLFKLYISSAPYYQSITQDDKDAVVAWHNLVREETGAGKAACLGGACPASTDLASAKLVWNDGLAKLAENYNPCVQEHNPNRKTEFYDICQADSSLCPAEYSGTAEQNSVGENINYRWRQGESTIDDLITSLKSGWYTEEAAKWDPSQISKYQSGSWGHYTQVIWEKTKYVGCAIHYCPDPDKEYPHMYTFICDYYIAGNFLDEPVYTAAATSQTASPIESSQAISSTSTTSSQVTSSTSNFQATSPTTSSQGASSTVSSQATSATTSSQGASSTVSSQATSPTTSSQVTSSTSNSQGVSSTSNSQNAATAPTVSSQGPSDSSLTDSESEDSMSSGVIIAIVIGGVLFILILLLLLIHKCCCVTKQPVQDDHKSPLIVQSAHEV